jgi:hypothetical protein
MMNLSQASGMRSTFAACALLYSMLTSGCAQGREVKTQSPAQSQVDALATKLANREIGRVEILQIPARILTRTRITPGMLERQFHYKLTIRDVRGEVHQEKLTEAAKSITVQPETEMPDLRWGVIFYGLDDTRVGALYFDKTGSRGGVGDTPVSFKGGFFEWLDGNFSGCFR